MHEEDIMSGTQSPDPTEPKTDAFNLFSFREIQVDGISSSDFVPLQRQIKVLYVFLIAIFVPLMAALVIIQYVTPLETQDEYRLLVVFCTFLNVFALLLLRYGYFKAAAQTLVVMTMIAPWGCVLIDPSIVRGDFIPLLYMVFSIILSTLFLSVWETVIISVVQLGLLVYVVFATGLGSHINAASLLYFVSLLSLFSIVINYVRETNMRQLLYQTRLLDKSRKNLHQQSILDPLTGLYNRRHLEVLMQEELALAEQNGTSLGFLMIDLDNFKAVNDTYGHDVGDRVLREVGQILSQSIRQTDYLFRHGGDELVLVMPGTSIEVAERRAGQLRKNIEILAIPLEGKLIDTLSISVGVVTYPDHGDTREALVRAADKALYQAKSLGRNRVELGKLE